MAGAVDNEDRVTMVTAMYDGEVSAEDYADRVEAVMYGGGSVADPADDDSTKTTMTTMATAAAATMAATTTTAATTMTRQQQQRAQPWKGRHNVDAAGE